jgi:hypothetical protein
LRVEGLKKLGKLKGRSLDELRTRGAQALNAQAERRGLSALTRVPSDAAFFKLLDQERVGPSQLSAERLLEHFRARTSPSFFAAFADREETLRELRRRFGAREEERVIESAARNIEGRFDLLGLHDLRFGVPVDWHLEPVSGLRAPRLHWSRIDYLDASVAGDKKIIWELNRHQYFNTLGRAYWYTGEELYAQIFVEHLTNWMDENPPKIGINWASSLEISFRAINWLWALHFFKDSPSLTPQVLMRLLKMLYLHARHLETYLSTYFSPNTHLTGEALGLFYLGQLLPEFRRATAWKSVGRSILMRELARHVRADGVYFEQSSYYQRYTTDFYTHLLILSRLNGEAVEDLLEEKLKALLDHLMYITRPDGTTPLYGDDDGGRLLMIDGRAANDFRATLSTGAVLFERADYKYVADEIALETLWLLGPKGCAAFDGLEAQTPGATSRAFEDGGYYLMRDGWSSESNYLLIDGGPHGSLNCAHAHADALAFDLASHGRTLLVDPGTYNYTGVAGMRDHFRGSAAHNTLTIDGQSSSVPAGPFSWQQVAKVSTHAWMSRERFDYFEASHDGYERLASPAKHTRSVLFIKGDYLLMLDRVAATGKHLCELHFQFAPDAKPVLESESVESVEDHVPAVVREHAERQPGLEIFLFGEGGKWREESGWVSECYRQRRAAPSLVFVREALGAQEFVTFLIPHGAGENLKTRVREIEATGGRAFEVCGVGTRDVILLGGDGMVEAARLGSDFESAWVRFSSETGELEELLLLGVGRGVGGGRERRSFYLDGQKIFDAASRTNYLYARRAGEDLRVETDEEKYDVKLTGRDVKMMI